MTLQLLAVGAACGWHWASLGGHLSVSIAYAASSALPWRASLAAQQLISCAVGMLTLLSFTALAVKPIMEKVDILVHCPWIEPFLGFCPWALWGYSLQAGHFCVHSARLAIRRLLLQHAFQEPHNSRSGFQGPSSAHMVLLQSQSNNTMPCMLLRGCGCSRLLLASALVIQVDLQDGLGYRLYLWPSCLMTPGKNQLGNHLSGYRIHLRNFRLPLRSGMCVTRQSGLHNVNTLQAQPVQQFLLGCRLCRPGQMFRMSFADE